MFFSIFKANPGWQTIPYHASMGPVQDSLYRAAHTGLVQAKYGQTCAHMQPLLACTSPYYAHTGPMQACLLGG